MQSHVGLWEGSCAIRLPKVAVNSLGLYDGKTVSLHIEDGGLVIRPANRRYLLAELVQETKQFIPPESSDDPATGSEAL
ncbi:MAG: AbrB/MazE/SpoVT family DNA-binding domain-containing protein [Pseudomonadota bacterium]